MEQIITAQKKGPGETLNCLRCNVPLEQLHYETWKAPILSYIVKPVQNYAYKCGIRVLYCPQCGKIEFHK